LAEVHILTLRRAAALVGGEHELALLLKVTPSHLALWLMGVEVPPHDVFLRAVDIVMEKIGAG
jgi:DNA-binding transcriptional regulator YdaS (Cro superfamily)